MPELLPYEPLTPDWHAARRQGVTATDIVTILGLSSYDSQYSLFWRKLGQIGEVEDSDRFRLGRYLEPYALERWGAEHPDRFLSGGGSLWRNDARAWQMATLDSAVWSGEHGGPLEGVLELKSWADADRHSWGQGCVYDDDKTLLVHDDQMPAKVRAQVLWQMDVMDVAAGHVGVVFLPSGEFRSYTIEHEGHSLGEVHPAIAEVMIEVFPCDICRDLLLMRAAGEEFMARLRLELPPPDPDASAATLAAVRARFTRQPDKEAEVSPQTYEAWIGAKFEAGKYLEEARWLEILLREQAGEATVLTITGQPVARRVISDAAVKAHTRHQDYIRRIKQGDDDE